MYLFNFYGMVDITFIDFQQEKSVRGSGVAKFIVRSLDTLISTIIVGEYAKWYTAENETNLTKGEELQFLVIEDEPRIALTKKVEGRHKRVRFLPTELSEALGRVNLDHWRCFVVRP